MKSEMRIFAFVPQTFKMWGVTGGYRLSQHLSPLEAPLRPDQGVGFVFQTAKTLVKSVIKAETWPAGSSHVGSGSHHKVMHLQFASRWIA
jgi:hypothetical protein